MSRAGDAGGGLLAELAVRDFGVIPELSLLLRPGLTAVTGETGAGKTLIVDAIQLLVGGRADPAMVRPGASEAVVEGRFVDGDEEVVLTRVVPADGRSRAYVNGRLATASLLAECGARLLELHGQHAHQALLTTGTQRAALDRFGGIDLEPWSRIEAELAAIDAELATLGGDAHARAREMDLLRYQVDEIAAASLGDPHEEQALEAEDDRLGRADAYRDAATHAAALLAGDEGGVADGLAQARKMLGGAGPFASLDMRLDAAAAELVDVALELRQLTDTLESDPERLAAVQARRRLLADLRRKYGDTVGEVMAYGEEASTRLAAFAAHDERVAVLTKERGEAVARLDAELARVAGQRAAAAPALAGAIERHLRTLGMPKARVEVAVGGRGGAHVELLLAANPGGPVLPLVKVASGGELARAMLAVRLVLTEAPPTMVFDEVDAGIGGEAGIAVGRALANLASSRQVLVVTHLPQVAAFADIQVALEKKEARGRTAANARIVDGEERVKELSRMLAGRPDSEAARGHAEELLEHADGERAGRRRRG